MTDEDNEREAKVHSVQQLYDRMVEYLVSVAIGTQSGTLVRVQAAAAAVDALRAPASAERQAMMVHHTAAIARTLAGEDKQ